MENAKNLRPTQTPRVKLITFGAGGKGIGKALTRLKKQSGSFNLIDEFQAYTDEDLGEDYYGKFQPLLRENPLGFGLWSWKPYLIFRELISMQEGDVLIYLDAGVELNKRGQSIFTHYLDFVARNDVLLFSLDHQQRHWTKDNEFIYPANREYFRNQVVAGVLMFRVSDLALKTVREWKRLSEIDSGELIKNPKVTHPQKPNFREHRHDQSLLSKVAYNLDLKTIPDETIFRPWRAGKNYPFLALRNKASRWSWIWWAQRTPFIIWRIAYVVTNPRLLQEFWEKIKRSTGTPVD
jgi:hypothetical protein